MDSARRRYHRFEIRAIEFCRLIETREPIDLRLLRQSLTRLYLGALLLPAVVAHGLDLPDRVSHADWQQIETLISGRLATDLYWIVFQPITDHPNEPVAASLADDLADIWRDLVRGLRALNQDRPKYEGAVWWEWRFGFETHWGVHAVDALYALHRIDSGL